MPRLSNLDRISHSSPEAFKMLTSRTKATGTMFLGFFPALALIHGIFTIIALSPRAEEAFLPPDGFVVTAYVSALIVIAAFFASAVWVSGWRAHSDYKDDAILDKYGVTAHTEWLYSSIVLAALLVPFLIWNRIMFGTSSALLFVPIVAAWCGLVLGIAARRRIIRYRPPVLWWIIPGLLILGVGSATYVVAYYLAHY